MIYKPLIPYGWLRALLYFVFFIGLIFLFQKGMLVLVGLIGLSPTNSPSVPGYLNRELWLSVIVTFLAAITSTWIFRRYVDRKTMGSLGFAIAGFGQHALTGFFLGIAMLGAGTLFLMLMKYLLFTGIQLDGASLIINIAMMTLIAFSEELIFRGYLLNNLLQSTNKWLALLISALLFAFVHASNPGIGVLPLVEIFVGGIMLGINYIYTKNLWFSIALHFSWNFFQGPILGYKVSGLQLEPLMQQSLDGPALYTGGSFGFEGSVLALFVNLLAISYLVITYQRKGLANYGRQR